MKILTVVGARPQFVKAAVLSRHIQQNPSVEEVLVHTGQHYDENMSKVFFEEMSIPSPDYNLKTGGGQHGAMTALMLAGLEPIVIKEKPDLLLVYGDTNSTLAGALVATKLLIPIAHVEAGLRSFNMAMPEEINRVLTDRISSWLFCPTFVSQKNLLSEGVDSSRIHIVGDIMYDAVLFYSDSLKPSEATASFVEKHKEFSLCTLHRAENTDDPDKLKSIFKGLREISNSSNVLIPMHPRTQKKIEEYKINTGKIKICSPLGYGDILFLLKNCQVVLTDSGGLQKEAYFFSKPCITLREETEWVETVESGVNYLVGSDCDKIISTFHKIFLKERKFPVALYGRGNTGALILKTLVETIKN